MMARSNPYKKKRRAAKITILIYGEGLAEYVFLKLLKSYYVKNKGPAITLRKGKGGTASNLVKYASKLPGDFNKRFVLLDCDKSKKEMRFARELAKRNKLMLLESKPCLESLLLSILDNKKRFDNKSSALCKKEFEKKYISKKRRSDFNKYLKLFPKALLDERRGKLQALNKLILVLEGKK